jgi:hypothetical protein
MTQTAKLTASDEVQLNYFGQSVSISGNIVVVGAEGNKSARGAVYVFVKPASGWVDMTQTAKLTAANAKSGDYVGFSVSVSGGTVVAGAVLETVGSHKEQGAAYVFVKPRNGWMNRTETSKLTASDGGKDDHLGWTISVSGNTVAVGAPDAVIHGTTYQGAVYVFAKPANGWKKEMHETAKLTASDGGYPDTLGFSVAISGKTLVSGAIGHNDSRGVLYVYRQPTSGWKTTSTFNAELSASNGQPNDLLGWSASFDGKTLAAGANQVNNLEGAAYVFGK